MVFRSGQGAALGTALLAANDGIDVVLGTEYRQQGPRSFMIDSRSAADYAQLFEACPEFGAIYFLADVESGPLTPDQQALSERQQGGALALFRLAQALARSRHAGKSSSVVVVTRQAQTVFEGSEPAAFPYGAALTGLSRVLARERTELRLSVLDANAEELDRDPDSVARAAELLEGAAAPGQALAVAFRMGQLYAPEIEPLRVDSTGTLPIREDGVSLILGGAGGLGTAVSLHLARKVRCRFVWVGRSPLRRSQQKAIEQIEATGSEVLYCQSDARDWAALERVVQQAKQRFGAIHGVIHSALVLKDGALDRLDEASFDEVLTTKVLTSAGLMAVLESETLDFALFFSSAVSFTGPHGQANYAAGCTFEDSLGAYWAERCRASGRHTRVQVINWGYWSETGIVSGSRYREALESQGILGFSTAEGLRALDRIWSCTAVERAIVMKADPRVFGQLGVDYDRTGQYLPQAVRDLGAGLGNTLDTFSRENPPPSQERAHADALERLQAYARLGVLRSFQGEGVFNESGECHDETGLERRLAVIPQYQRLYRAALDALERAGWITRTEDGWTATAAIAAEPLKQRVSAWSEQGQAVVAAEPGLAPHLTLLERCLDSLMAVLRGERLAPEVLFPAGSMSLVEPIYKGNPLSDHFNHLVAEIVRRTACALPADAPPLRVLEIGAGTGGTSTSVLAALAPFAQRVTYAYTDVSLGFLEFGRKRFGVEYPFVSFKLLDIESDPALQGLTLGGYDIVLASNVLHATRSIASTLRHAKALLGRGGLLVINEITGVQDFTTFTFGLLEGWWLFDDEQLRLPHAPLLAPRAWVRALTEEGFRQPMLRILPDASEPQIFSQSVVVATKDVNDHRELRAAAEAPLSLPARRPARPASAVTDPHVEGVCERIKYEICALLHIDVAEIDADTPISDLGIDSILAVSAVERINAALAIQLKVAEVFNHPTIRALAVHVLSEFEGTIRLDAAAPPVEPASSPLPASPKPASSPTPLVRIQPTGVRCPSFWVHGAHGEVSWAVRLAQQLGRDFPVYGLEAPALKGNDALLGAVPDMAAHYVAAVRSVAPHGPYVLGGYSFGGNVAVEMAHLLRLQGEHVSHIVLLDAYAPGSNMAQGIARAVDETYRLLMIGNIFCTLWKAERFLSAPILTADANQSDPTSLRRAAARHLLANARTRLSFDEILALLETSERLAQTNGLALERHRPAIHPPGTQTILFQGRHGFVGPENRLHLPPLDLPPNDPTNGWQPFFEAPITVIGLDCDHFGLAAEPFIEQVANRLTLLLP